MIKDITTVILGAEIEGPKLESVLLEAAKKCGFSVKKESYSYPEGYRSISFITDFRIGAGASGIDGSSRISLIRKTFFIPHLVPFADILYNSKEHQDRLLIHGDQNDPNLARYSMALRSLL